jgi:hypothetical protein
MSFRFHIQIDAAEAEERTFWMIGEDDTRLVITPSREAKLFRAINEAWNDVRKDLARYSICRKPSSTIRMSGSNLPMKP